MAVTWLHVSDFHFTGKDSYDRSVVLKALVAAVARFRMEGRKPDLIFATGDIGHSGKADEYTQATKFFDELREAAGVDKNRLFVVPGNHDVDRARGDDLIETLTSTAKSDQYFAPGKVKRHISERQRAFIDWFNQYFQGVRVFSEDTTCGPVECANIDNLSIRVMPINTATFCHGNSDEGKLWIGRICLGPAADEINRYSGGIRVAMVHHPFSWLCEDERQSIAGTLAGGVDVILRGHLHRTETMSCTTGDGTVLYLAAGAAYQGSTHQMRALYVSIERDEATVFPIHYVDQTKPAWVHDTGYFTSQPGNCGKFKIPRLGAISGVAGGIGNAAPSGGATVTTVAPESAEAEKQRKVDSEWRFRMLKAGIANALAASEIAMSMLEDALKLPAPAPPRPRARADKLVEALIAETVTFEQGKVALVKAYKELSLSSDGDGVKAIKTTSQFLLPWLYVTRNNILCEHWSTVSLGEVLPLAAGLAVFAEIVMAGIYRRETTYQAGMAGVSPRGKFEIALVSPESGITDATEENFRNDLFTKCAVPAEYKRLRPEDKDKGIRAMLTYFLEHKGIRWYLVCDAGSVISAEKRQYKEMIDRISKRYPEIAVVELDSALRDPQLTIFNGIRDLLLPAAGSP